MRKKYTVDEVKNIISENFNKIKSESDKWFDFMLNTADLYGYSFKDKLSANAVNPNAKMILDFDTWSERLHAQINKGANGIPLLSEKNGREVVSYVFDWKDTNTKIKAWEIPPNAENEIKRILEKNYGFKNGENLQDMIRDEVDKNFLTLADSIKKSYPDMDLEKHRNFLFSSMLLPVMKRCGFDTEDIRNNAVKYNIPDMSDHQLLFVSEEISKSVKEIINSVKKAVITAEKQILQTKAEDKQSPAFSNAQKSEQQNNIIGNTPYRYIGKKTYRKLDTQTALKLAEEIEKAGYKYSGKKNDDNTITFTVSRDNIAEIDKFIENIKEQIKNEKSFSDEEIDIARKTNLVDFLHYRGEQLKRVGTNEYTLPEHDSMRISSEKGFYWNSRNIGGNALDFCMKYYNMDFQSSMLELLSFNGISKDISQNAKPLIPHSALQDKAQEPQEEETHNPLPYPLDDKTNRVYAYLTKTRGIDEDIVKKFIDEGSIAQDINGNAVFKIFDKDGNLSGAEITGTLSDKRYKQNTERNGNGFTIPVNPDVEPERILFFESAIDAISFYNLSKRTNNDSFDECLITSMGGLKDKVIYTAIEKFAEKYGKIPLCAVLVDNDEAGKNFSQKQKEKGYEAFYVDATTAYTQITEKFPNEKIKDWNDLLRTYNKLKEIENAKKEKPANKEEIPLSEQLVNISIEIKDKEKIVFDFTQAENYGDAVAVYKELLELSQKANEIKEMIQLQEITQEDVKDLRSIEPNRKSVQNMLDEEVAKTPKFEKLLNEEMGEKSAYEMRNSDNEWRNDESKTVPIINIQKRDIPKEIKEIRNSQYINDIRNANDTRTKDEINNNEPIKLKNLDTGIEIQFVRKSIEETVAKAIQDDTRNIPVEARIATLYQMRELVENAVCFDSIIYMPKEKNSKSSNALFMHRMYGITNYDGEKYLANLAVEESYSTNEDESFRDTSNRLYSFRDIKITPVKLLGFQSHSSPQIVDTDTSSDVIDITIPQLYELVKTYDQTFFENKEAAGRTERVAEIAAHNEFEKAVEVLNEHTENKDFSDDTAKEDELNETIEENTYYAISLTSDAYKASYYISIIDGNTGDEVSPYYDKDEFMPTFETVEEAVEYCHKNDIDFENAKEVDSWQMIENELANDIDHGVQTATANEITTGDNLGNYQNVVSQNFKIRNTEFEKLSQKENFRNNVSAIKTLIAIESENRTATPEEQEILSKYVGWGGLADAFDENKPNWKIEYTELKELLTDSEYTSARSSTLNAHYTQPMVIDAIYKGLENLGLDKGKILEPSMGVGNFFGRLPENLRETTRLYGVEIDSISGRIAKQLYPKANIQIKGFEKTAFQSNFFDVAIGNVPFGSYRINDNDFKNNDLIHDYFFKKSLDKVRNGGVIAFITSKGTLDKQDNSVRKYLAERTDLLGAVRLPNTAFKANAGTEVTSDILFLQKRDNIRDFTKEEMPDWVNLSKNENGIEMNSYFVNHPDMICGEMAEVSGRFGIETTCNPIPNAELSELLNKAVSNIKGEITQDYAVVEEQELNPNINIIPENYRNFCYAVIDNDIYFREGQNMVKQDFEGKKSDRIKGMIEISETLRDLITYQKEDYPDDEIQKLQEKLNNVYDGFTKKFGLLSDKINKSLFKNDDTSALLLSLENTNDKGEFAGKADIFTKRTIVPYIPVVHTDTASEALAVSISEKAKVDLDFMSELCGKVKEEIIKDLEGVIFENPLTKKYETADEYLSGNVREKLKTAEQYAETDNKYAVNVQSLKNVQPEDLKPSEISVQLGSTWIPTKYYEQFMYELLDTPKRCRSDYAFRDTERNPFGGGGRSDNQSIIIDFDEHTASYGISNKSSFSADRTNIKANKTFGTERMNAYKIIEETLNLKPVKVMDYIEDAEGKKRAVINENETTLAQEKQDRIKKQFQEWIFDDFDRTQDLCRIYNDKFNSIRPREYDGSHITFGGINPEIKLRKHQIDAIAHTLYGGNTLLAHSVGAGKTFEMVASAMESKRLGLCTKSMLVVPKHIVNQVAKEFLQLYPTANILVPNEKDFSKDNRQKFCSRIATGNYDAVILSHTQLEKIPLSIEKQIEFIENEIRECTESIERLKYQQEGRGFSVKQLETTKKNLQIKLESLNNDSKRDSVITFEEMGVDKLYIDEAHLFKNLYFNTKMGRNVSGINASSVSQRATDLFMKCRYLDEKTGSKGVVFATGTPISNSMSEMYTMQNFLQHDKLKERGLNHFDAWASSFGETKMSLELAPEGKGYQMKTRFAKFFNLPELMNMFKEMADVKTADVLNLPVPKANYHTVATEASEYQKEMVDGLAERANKIRKREVSADVDNMLNVTNDGRKLALDQRLMNDMLPDYENSKVNECVKNVYEIWQNTKDEKSTQMIFCDQSTPHYDGSFNVYDDIKEKLTKKGVPENEIKFIHDCKNDEQKQALFTKVRNGEVRVLLGSTGKMGTGTNAQKKLKALHHLDCPYRPADLEQRNGRIIRQGNENPEVDIYNYVTKGTFDAYLFQLVENKQKFISQVMTSKSPARSAEDVDETVLSYAQIKALAADNPKIKEKMDLDIEVNRLRVVFSGYQENKRDLQSKIAQEYPERIQKLTENITGFEKDLIQAENSKTTEFSKMTINGKTYTDKKDAGTALLESCRSLRIDQLQKENKIGEYRGFDMFVSFDKFERCFNISLKNTMSHTVEIGKDTYGNIIRLDNAIDNGIAKKLNSAKTKLEEIKHSLEVAKKEVTVPFPQLEELREKESRLDKLNKELSLNKDVSDDTSKENEKADTKNKDDIVK